MKLIRTNSSDPAFIALVRELDAYLAIVDGEDHAFYDQYNSIEALDHCVVISLEDTPVACGAIKRYKAESFEIKRMFVNPKNRRKGLAKELLAELEQWAVELDAVSCVLETGKKQVEAIALYTSVGYEQIPNYGQYDGVENSLCFQKELSHSTDTKKHDKLADAIVIGICLSVLYFITERESGEFHAQITVATIMVLLISILLFTRWMVPLKNYLLKQRQTRHFGWLYFMAHLILLISSFNYLGSTGISLVVLGPFLVSYQLVLIPLCTFLFKWMKKIVGIK